MKKISTLILLLCFGASISQSFGQCTQNLVVIDLLTDNYPIETAWQIIETGTGNAVATSTPYTVALTQFSDSVCLPDGCYEFIITDTYGDGICCTYGNGNFVVFDANGTIYSGGSFGTVDSSGVFCLGNSPCTGPTAMYSSSTAGLTATFTDASTSTAGGTTYAWDFGDGNTSTLQNPAHTYAAGGSYVACLIVADSCSADTSCSSITVVAPCTGPTSMYSSSAAGLTVTFTDASTSTSGGLSYLWDFGDGNTSGMQNPVHSYAADGTYTVCLTVTDSCASDSSCSSVTVVTPCTGPTAMYSSSNTGLAVAFTDASTSTAGGASYFWDFGDGNTSTIQNPVHTYAAGGTYIACLIVSDSCSADTSCNSITVVTPCTGPAAMYSSSATGLTATFTDASTSTAGGTTYLWDFGDGNTSTTQNPVHTYAADGTYTVCLIVSDSCDIDSMCSAITVTAPCVGPTAMYSFTTTGLTATFTDASTSTAGSPSYQWDFGDGNTSTMQNPVHTYAADGAYTVCFTVTDSCDVDVACDTVTIQTIGFDEYSLANGLSIYPNPSAGMMNIVSESVAIDRIQLFSVSGSLVMDVSGVSSTRFELNAEDLVPGMYVVRIQSENQIVSRRITIQR